ncbi:MAG TPA: phytanoyl-CoA dioxygenase family protein [Chthonomonadaceae bacterium]|nr:phytanoyl-CoA dioxygenase family protein [Chthonomonadaceae bacterium]
MALLQPEDHAFFRENGYLLVRGVVPRRSCEAVIAAIWEFLGMDPDDPEDWYRPPLSPGGMVEMYHHPSMWDNRQHPRVHQVFAELLGTETLWVSLDRVNMKPPRHPDHPEYDHKGFIHWDVSTEKLPIPFGVQGLLYLADTDADQGGFQCVPELYRNFEAWLQTQPSDRDPFKPDLTGLTVTPIPGQAGDLVIWNRLLAHGNGHNVSTRPRFAQYLAMHPAREDDEAARQERIACWRERRPPQASFFPGDPRRIEQKSGKTADLTPLGRKLLGLDRWES